jgi:hypothetical protein
MHETLHRDAGFMTAEPSRALSADAAFAARLRRRLIEAGFTDEGIRIACSAGMSHDPWSLATGQPPRDGSPFSTLVTHTDRAFVVDAAMGGIARADGRQHDLDLSVGISDH